MHVVICESFFIKKIFLYVMVNLLIFYCYKIVRLMKEYSEKIVLYVATLYIFLIE